MVKPDPSTVEKVKEELASYTDEMKKKMKKAVEMNVALADTIKRYTENIVVDARDFSLSFLPEKVQQHVINMNKEALLALVAVLEQGISTLEKPSRDEGVISTLETPATSEKPKKTEAKA